MAVRLIAEVLKYAAATPDLATAERLVLLLVAERANEHTRVAKPGGSDQWSLAAMAGMSPSYLRNVLGRLSGRGVELRVPHTTDSNGRPVYGTWRQQSEYALPILLGATPQAPPTPPKGAAPQAPTDRRGPPVGASPRTLGATPQAPNTMPLSPSDTVSKEPTGLTPVDGGTPVAPQAPNNQLALWPTAVPDDTAPRTSPTVSSGGTVVGEWIDYCGRHDLKLPRKLIGQYASLIGGALAEGFTIDQIKRALAAMLARNLANRPSLLPNYLVEVQTGPERRPRPSTTDQQVADALAIGRRLQATADAAPPPRQLGA